MISVGCNSVCCTQEEFRNPNPDSRDGVSFQQRCQMRNRILSKAVPGLELRRFATPKTVSLWSASFWGFNSDRILQLFV